MDSDLTHIFNLLKYFTNFEDDSSSSDCKYHIKLHTKQNKRSLKTPKISPTKSNQNLNTNSNYKCWLDNLPDLVKTKIFKFMSHKSLIDFTNAFPKYKNFIVNPVFWSKIKINFDGHDEHHHIEHILKYLNDNLKQIYVNFTKIRNGNFETYLLNMPKLTHFSLHGLKKAHSSEYEYLVDLLATKLAYLKYIDITHFEINDDQLAKLSLHLNNLNSIKLYADNLSDGGLYNFVNNTKKLVYLEIIGSKLCKLKNPKSFELLYTRHSQSLEALKFQSLKIDNNAFKSIDKCIKLKELSIKNCKIVNFEVLKFIASCKKLKSLEIDNNKGFDGQAFLEFFKNSTMMNLKRLHLKNCRLDDESLKLLASCCSHLEDLALVKCFEITDNGLNTLFENLQDLESLVIDYLNTQLTVKMFANVPVKVLKKIRYINIHNHMGYIESNDFEAIFTNICMNKQIELVLSYDGEGEF